MRSYFRGMLTCVILVLSCAQADGHSGLPNAITRSQAFSHGMQNAAFDSAALYATGKRAADEPGLKIIHPFCARGSCLDGYDLYGSLTIDASGNFYGTTFQGGASTFGTVFELVKDGDNHWKRKTLYQFCQKAMCTDGRSPIAPPIVDTAGNLIGTTYWGGLEDDFPNYLGHGVIYKLTPNANKTHWKYSVLHTFCANGTCADGAQPSTAFTYKGSAEGLPYDGVSPLYLPTKMGGSHNYGAVIQFEPQAGTDHWQESVLYDFCARGATCLDGALPGPNASLLLDKSGNLFGTTMNGGNAQTIYGGVVFELTNTGQRRWSEATVHRFTPGKLGFDDGAYPYSGVVWGPDGSLFGTTFEGGPAGQGVLYELKPSGGKWNYRVLHTFCQGGISQSCPDGAGPWGGLLLDGAGNIFGTTSGGGYGYDINGTGGGLIFEMSKSFQILYFFCSAEIGNCKDGEYPHSDLIRDSEGRIFGSTDLGGKYFGGEVFQVKP